MGNQHSIEEGGHAANISRRLCPDPANLVAQADAARDLQRRMHELGMSPSATHKQQDASLQPALPDGSVKNKTHHADDPPQQDSFLSSYEEDNYDYIIVGAGAAGCTLAHELIKGEPKLRILLLEAGPAQAFANDRIHAPFSCFTLWQGFETDWGYTTEKQPLDSCVGGAQKVIHPFLFPRGKVLGGSTATNAMIYIRGQSQDYDNWNQGIEEYKAIWSWESCLEAFKATECNQRTEPTVEFMEYHGFGGQLCVQDSNAGIYTICQAVVDVGVETSRLQRIPENLDMNGASQNGVGKFQVTMKNGRRCTVSDTYLRSATEHRVGLFPEKEPLHPKGSGRLTGLNVKSDCHVTELLFDPDDPCKVTGVAYTFHGGHKATATREVILSAGAINTPQILMLSGIGPGLGRLDLPVGKGLMDHPLVPLTASVEGPTMQSEVHIWSNGAEVAYMFKADGARMTENVNFADKEPDMQINVAPSIWDQAFINPLPGGPPAFGKDGITFGIVLNAPLSKGKVELTNKEDPFQRPRIFTGYYTDQEQSDMRRMISSVKFAREQIKKLSTKDPWRAKLLGWNDEYGDYKDSDEGIEQFIADKTYTSFHPCGTCKMAPKDKGGVVNERLRVHGAEGLRIVDASIFPVIPTGNLQAAVVMTAYKAAKLIRQDYPGSSTAPRHLPALREASPPQVEHPAPGQSRPDCAKPLPPAAVPPAAVHAAMPPGKPSTGNENHGKGPKGNKAKRKNK